MSFRQSNTGTRTNNRRPAWQVQHTHVTVKKASPASMRQSQQSLPSSVPSYAMGSTSNPNNIHNTVTRHHAVRLSDHHPRRVQMAHNGPIPVHKSIPSPRQKARHRLAPSTFSLEGTRNSNRPNSPVSAEDRASARRQEMATKQHIKEERAVQFQAALKKRLSKKVKKQRQEAEQRRQAWVALEVKSKQKAADWIAHENEMELANGSSSQRSDSSGTSPDRAPRTLQNHVLNITAQSQKARAALFSRKSRMLSEPRTGRKATAEAAANVVTATPSSTVSAATTTTTTTNGKNDIDSNNDNDDTTTTNTTFWSPDMSFNNGMIDGSSIDRQSQAHLVVTVRKAEAIAQREHAQKYRAHVLRKTAIARREAELEKRQALQDSRVEEARMANEKAREDYEEFLKVAEEGVNAMASYTRNQVKLEENVSARYVTALRQNLCTKLNRKGLHVPNLCSCVPPTGKCGVQGVQGVQGV